MNNWIVIFLVALLSVAIIVGFAVLCGVALLGAGKRYREKQAAEDAKALQAYLPGKDCGCCGQDTCRAFALEAAWDAGLLKACPCLSQQDREEMEALLARWDAQLRARQEADRRSEEVRSDR